MDIKCGQLAHILFFQALGRLTMVANRLVTGNRLRNITFPLVLGSEVTGAVKVRGGYASGAGTIKYKIDHHERFDRHLHLSGKRVYLMKEVEQGINALDPNIRSTMWNMFSQQIEYDTRAFAYVLGRRMALLGIGKEVNIAACTVYSYSGAAGGFGNGDFAICPGTSKANAILTEYAHIANGCGMPRIYIQIPKSQRKGKLGNTAWTGTMHNAHCWGLAYNRSIVWYCIYLTHCWGQHMDDSVLRRDNS